MNYHYRIRERAGVPVTIERATRQRAAITTAIRAAKRPLSPAEVLEHARASVQGLGLATVYRTLKLLIEDGSIQAINLPGESARYEPAESAHHHHFQCNMCRRVYDIAGCPGDLCRLAPRGFRVERHDVTLYGRCSDCGKAAAAR
jgi:Fur family ferric uptake transcriptional regulator